MDVKNSFTTKVRKHIPTGFSMFTTSSFINIENHRKQAWILKRAHNENKIIKAIQFLKKWSY